MLLELERDFMVVPLLAILGVFNGFLYVTLFWNIDAYEISLDTAANISWLQNLVGFCFFLGSDQIIEMSFGQVMIVPLVFPVYKREVSNHMYKPTPFFFARVLISTMTFVLYPLMVTMTVFWFLGMPVVGLHGWLTFWGILSLTALVGSALGFTLGAMFPTGFAALDVNQTLIILFSFGAGLYANTGTSANILVRLISWISPLHYSTELLLRRLF